MIVTWSISDDHFADPRVRGRPDDATTRVTADR